MDASHEASHADRDDLEGGWARARGDATQADRTRSALIARKEALEMGLDRKDGAGALLAATDSISGLLGSVAALLSVRGGYETAVAVALGQAADAVAVEGPESSEGRGGGDGGVRKGRTRWGAYT